MFPYSAQVERLPAYLDVDPLEVANRSLGLLLAAVRGERKLFTDRDEKIFQDGLQVYPAFAGALKGILGGRVGSTAGFLKGKEQEEELLL